MAVRGDDIAERIEQKIREAMDKVVADVRTSIEDVREALHQQLDAAIRSVQADVKALAVRQHLEEGMREIESDYAANPPQPAAPAAPAVGAQRIKSSLQSIEKGTNQVEILNALLEQSLTFGSRAALMILKGDNFAGWKGVGFTAHGGNDDQIKRFSESRESVPQFDELMRDEHVVAWNGDLSSRFGVTPAERAVLVPMVIKDKVAAALYVDAVTDDLASFDQNAIEILVFSTGMLIDTQAIRKKVPSPTLSQVGESSGSQTSGAQPARAFSTVSQPAPAPERLPEAPAPTSRFADISPDATVAIRMSSLFQKPAETAAPEPPPQPEPPRAQPPRTESPQGSSRRFQVETEPPTTTTAAWPKTVARDQLATPTASPSNETISDKTTGSDLADRPSTQYVPPPGIGRSGALGGPRGDDDQKRHDDARRFARLLVSEIKLYNESQVDQGRRDRDLYERLKEDIDRSRQMYEERVADEIRKDTNYFYEELVRILADGNADALGL